MARKGTFGSKLSPFGGGAFSDLSVYQIGATAPGATAPAYQAPVLPWEAPNYVAVAGGSWTSGGGGWTYTPPEPPPAPTVAPAVGVLPEPVLPRPTLPWIYLNPDTSAAREEIRQRALDAGLTPTTATINATYAANKARLLAELLAAGG